MMTAALLLYFAVAALFLVQTIEDGGSKHLRWDGYRILGVLLALAWPVALAIILVVPLRETVSHQR